GLRADDDRDHALELIQAHACPAFHHGELLHLLFGNLRQHLLDVRIGKDVGGLHGDESHRRGRDEVERLGLGVFPITNNGDVSQLTAAHLAGVGRTTLLAALAHLAELPGLAHLPTLAELAGLAHLSTLAHLPALAELPARTALAKLPGRTALAHLASLSH